MYELSICLWIKRTSDSGTHYLVNNRGGGSANKQNRGISLKNKDKEFYVSRGDGSVPITDFESGTDWEQICVVYGTDRVSFFQNGAKSSVLITEDRSVDPSLNSFVIGAVAHNYGSEFDGFMDDIRIYNRALSDHEVEMLARGLQVY